MNCINCGAKLVSKREDHRFVESGLSHVILLGVEVRRCPQCGEEELVLQNVEEINRTLAHAIASKAGPLAPDEYRFLRKYLGYSQSAFAEAIDVAQETVSRWERGHDPITLAYDATIRWMVQNQKPIDSYPPAAEVLKGIREEKREPAHLEIRKKKNNSWTVEPTRRAM